MTNTEHRVGIQARIKQHISHNINQVLRFSHGIVLDMSHLISELDKKPTDPSSFPGLIDRAIHISKSLSGNKLVMIEGKYLSVVVSDILADE